MSYSMIWKRFFFFYYAEKPRNYNTTVKEGKWLAYICMIFNYLQLRREKCAKTNETESNPRVRERKTNCAR